MQTFIRTAAATGLALAMAIPAPSLAQNRREPQLQVSYPTDGAMTCDQLLVEIGRMEQIAGTSAENAQNAQNQGALADGAAGVAINAAAYSGALAAVPGLGAFANMAGGAARRNAEARARAEAERIRIADQRRSLLSGIYQGRQCGVPAAPPVAAATATTESATPAETPVPTAGD
ncbi:hypothetical protein [uncultured Brevundimonas sp.]|uniref:hypothetical protein n=1 Tax=uncultured Brevundimonas sp. TaxID=213418 RepID=UPI0030EEDC64|tara:strand:- start:43538 stop:44062 length:525 start_codon:yes stop_codon:yes gene_type:complete